MSDHKYHKIIKDSVLGYISITEIEEKIIQHPAFHRLGDIVQNSLAYQVYPGAKYSRFEHSLGAMHLANRVFRTLLEKSGTGAYNWDKDVNNWMGDLRLWIREYVGKADVDIDREMVQFVRILGLLHDIGHFPYSHTFEEALGWVRALDYVESKKIDIIDFSFPISTFIGKSSKSKLEETLEGIFQNIEFPYSEKNLQLHEMMGHSIILSLLREIIDSKEKWGIFGEGTALLIVTVLELAVLNENEELKDNDSWENLYKVFHPLHEMISGGIDVDRLDSTLRDIYNSGLKIGSFDLDRIIENVSIIPEKESSPPRFVIDIKGLSSVTSFYITYSEMYRWLHYHHVVIILDKILSILSFILLRLCVIIAVGKKGQDIGEEDNLFDVDDKNFLEKIIQSFQGKSYTPEEYGEIMRTLFSYKEKNYIDFLTDTRWQHLMRKFFSQDHSSRFKFPPVVDSTICLHNVDNLARSLFYRENLPFSLWRSWYEFKERILYPLQTKIRDMLNWKVELENKLNSVEKDTGENNNPVITYNYNIKLFKL